MNLYQITETLFNGYSASALDALSILSVGSAIAVITVVNPIVSVLCLIGLFIGIACYLICIGLGFLGLSYLLVYVGAISILFLFIVMLINIRVSELLSETRNALPLILIVGLIFTNANYIIFPNKYYGGINSTALNIWDGTLAENSHINSIGNIMYSALAILLILTSIILLLAMVGAIAITVKRKNVRSKFDTYTNGISSANIIIPFIYAKISSCCRSRWYTNKHTTLITRH